MSARDELAGVILAAGYTKPRTVNSVEGLYALPGESVIRDDRGIVYELDYFPSMPKQRWWISTGTERRSHLSEIILPVTVLYEPTP